MKFIRPGHFLILNQGIVEAYRGHLLSAPWEYEFRKIAYVDVKER